MLRSDRNISERLFETGVTKVKRSASFFYLMSAVRLIRHLVHATVS